MRKKSTIKNYTSSVPAERSIARIEELIAEFGATDVSKQYDAGLCVRMEFAIIDPDSSTPLSIVLDANEGAVYSALRGKGFQTDRQLKAAREQSRRTAWKNMLELLQIQLTMLNLKQRTVLQSFLSDTVDTKTGKPIHQIIAATRRLLPSPAADPDIVEAT
jgi:hypothetical protein